MKYWYGFDSEEIESSSVAKLPEVQKMPCYPESGSIRIVSGTLVVKFSDQ